MVHEISNNDLTFESIPEADAAYEDISRFALTFNGYEYSDQCAEISNIYEKAFQKDGSLPKTLSELRMCLFFEQRRWRHFDELPDQQAMKYIYALVEAIRSAIISKDFSEHT